MICTQKAQKYSNKKNRKNIVSDFTILQSCMLSEIDWQSWEKFTKAWNSFCTKERSSKYLAISKFEVLLGSNNQYWGYISGYDARFPPPLSAIFPKTRGGGGIWVKIPKISAPAAGYWKQHSKTSYLLKVFNIGTFLPCYFPRAIHCFTSNLTVPPPFKEENVRVA